MGIDAVGKLTLRQFQERLFDIGELEKMFHGEGNGRRVRDRDNLNEQLKKRGLTPPKR